MSQAQLRLRRSETLLRMLAQDLGNSTGADIGCAPVILFDVCCDILNQNFYLEYDGKQTYEKLNRLCMCACMHVCQMTGALDCNTVGRTMRLSQHRHGTGQGISLRLNSSNFIFYNICWHVGTNAQTLNYIVVDPYTRFHFFMWKV